MSTSMAECLEALACRLAICCVVLICGCARQIVTEVRQTEDGAPVSGVNVCVRAGVLSTLAGNGFVSCAVTDAEGVARHSISEELGPDAMIVLEKSDQKWIALLPVEEGWHGLLSYSAYQRILGMSDDEPAVREQVWNQAWKTGVSPYQFRVRTTVGQRTGMSPTATE